MTPFELLIIARIQIGDRQLVRRYLATQAVMEELAAPLGLDPVLCSLAGLGAGLDARLCAANPERRGEVADEMLRAEGAPAEVAEAVRACFKATELEPLPRLALALIAADALVAAAFDLVSLIEEPSADQLSPRLLAARFERRAAHGGDRGAARGRRALALLELDVARAAACAVDGFQLARTDLGL
jgi:predicted hydrolase (HD superfamily)